ncbi:hypothetical protein Trihar35433_8599 [Trichoderma harzianum]|nr:hypothetical protein Trihar35433_8599 [Trichoderma harzianum]
MATSQTDYSYYINLFVTQQDFNRMPKGFSAALAAAQRAEETSSEKLFLNHGGFSTWAAYYLARRDAESGSHFAGQARLAQSLRTFDEKPVEFRISVVKRVKDALPSEFHEKFQTFSEKARKRQRTTAASADLGEENDHRLRTSVRTPIGSADNINVSTDTFQNNLFFNVEGVPGLRLANVFPPFLAASISAQPSTSHPGKQAADITMSFPLAMHTGNKFDSKMSLKIKPHRVGYFVMRLFDIYMESINEERCMVLLPFGSQAFTSGEWIIQGCKREVILEVFGGIVATAVKASLTYIDDEGQGKPVTECVTMAVSGKASEGAVITLSLAEKECVRIKQALWPK